MQKTKRFKELKDLIKNPDPNNPDGPSKLTGLESFTANGGFPKDSVLTDIPKEMILPFLSTLHMHEPVWQTYLGLDGTYPDDPEEAMEYFEQEVSRCEQEDYVLGSQDGQDWIVADLYEDMWWFQFTSSKTVTVWRYDRKRSLGINPHIPARFKTFEINDMLEGYYKTHSHFDLTHWPEIIPTPEHVFK